MTVGKFYKLGSHTINQAPHFQRIWSKEGNIIHQTGRKHGGFSTEASEKFPPQASQGKEYVVNN